MYTRKLLSLTCIFIGSVGIAGASGVTGATSTSNKGALVKANTFDIKYLEAAGWNIGNQSIQAISSQFGLTTEEKQAVIRGITNGAEGNEAPIDMQAEQKNMLESLQARAKAEQDKQMAVIAKEAQKNKAKGEAYFKKLAKSKKVSKTDSGLFYQVLKKGEKVRPTVASTVKVDYVGRLLDGTEFDSSKKLGEPATFSLEYVIPGFKEGLQLIGKGGKIRLFVPAELGYGDKQIPGIPAGSTLIFDVDLIDVIESEKV